MPKDPVVLLPRLQQLLTQMGENIRLARLRRKLSAARVAERAAISRNTLHAIEQGASTVSMGAYLQVLFVLGLEKTLLQLAADDVLGRKLQDAELVVSARAPKHSSGE
ncbi:helix-turn-helix domain-containing protein [Hymenobacter sp. BT186]|uniref:Helix-turn-helix domain-containing protein n=1 Tax=Hymenobacter telluris TaxID=2816474 RepID=A0A939F3R7_9BACT|nr:helix-turn-helix domain-containing protein [Hymenobacter telluris]MBO0360848.1 helix-turn-helix domain-containing protein [Hymenobacter telluris]MBW3376877.1 helix-turn-helix domain-containing protein [Hymenobacter norwichensis]